jgi:hypothetical protein
MANLVKFPGTDLGQDLPCAGSSSVDSYHYVSEGRTFGIYVVANQDGTFQLFHVDEDDVERILPTVDGSTAPVAFTANNAAGGEIAAAIVNIPTREVFLRYANGTASAAVVSFRVRPAG